MLINVLKHFLWVVSLVLIAWPANLYAEDIDRWANIESWEGKFSVYYHFNKKGPEGFYRTNYLYKGTINLDEKRISKRRRQTEWKRATWKGGLNASGSYDHEDVSESDVASIRNLTRSNASAVVDRANLKIDKRKGTYSIHIDFNIETTRKMWMKTGPPLNINQSDSAEETLTIASPVLPQPLPEGGLMLEGSSTFSGDILPSVVAMAGGMPSGGMESPDWGVSWQLWPKGSNPEPTLEFVEGGKDWVPEDDNTVEAVLKWDENFVPSEVRFTLYDISEEPGINLNSKDKNTDPDIEFDEENKSRKYEITQSGKTSVATKDELPFNEEKIIIHAKDFGAYSKLKAEIKVAGSWFVATAKPFELSYLPVPYDENENKIADKWEKDVGVYGQNLDLNWDEDPYPQGQKSNGDGFTLYEEYRGFQETGHVFRKGDHEQVKDGHVRMDPMYKDVFIHDVGGLFEKYYKPYNPANLNWHLIALSMMKKEGTVKTHSNYRWVNFNTSKKHFSRNQYAVYLEKGGTSTDPNDQGVTKELELYEVLDCEPVDGNFKFPLKCWAKISIYPQGIRDYVLRNYKKAGLDVHAERVAQEMLGNTVIHEVGHSFGITHHREPGVKTFTDFGKRIGVSSCAMRYDTEEEMRRPNVFNYSRSTYCKKGDTYSLGAADETGTLIQLQGHNCYGQINIKGD